MWVWQMLREIKIDSYDRYVTVHVPWACCCQSSAPVLLFEWLGNVQGSSRQYRCRDTNTAVGVFVQIVLVSDKQRCFLLCQIWDVSAALSEHLILKVLPCRWWGVLSTVLLEFKVWRSWACLSGWSNKFWNTRWHFHIGHVHWRRRGQRLIDSKVICQRKLSFSWD